MIVTDWVREALKIRREHRRMIAAGYRLHETDWEIIRGLGRHRERILDAVVSVDGKHVWTKIGVPSNQDQQAMSQDPNALKVAISGPRSDLR